MKACLAHRSSFIPDSDIAPRTGPSSFAYKRKAPAAAALPFIEIRNFGHDTQIGRP
jgi:hypothetical protein